MHFMDVGNGNGKICTFSTIIEIKFDYHVDEDKCLYVVLYGSEEQRVSSGSQ